MILFLTSSPCDNDVPQGIELPCIFFERNGFADALRDVCKPGMQLTVIAAAPDAYALNDEMLETFRQCFAYCGLEPASCTVIDRRNAENVPQLIKNSDVIILGGGHVPTQLKFFGEIGLKKLIANFDGVLMGISAGSMSCAATVYAIPEETGEATDPGYDRFPEGLGLTETEIIPHSNRLSDMRVDGLRVIEDIALPDSVGHTFYLLQDSSYILELNGRRFVRGKAWKIHEGYADQICEDGMELDLLTSHIYNLT